MEGKNLSPGTVYILNDYNKLRNIQSKNNPGQDSYQEFNYVYSSLNYIF